MQRNSGDIDEIVRSFDILADSQLVELRVIARLEAISIATAWRRVKSRQIPVVKIGSRTTRVPVGLYRACRSSMHTAFSVQSCAASVDRDARGAQSAAGGLGCARLRWAAP